MNEHDSEQIAGILVDNGYELIDNEDQADVVIFNTCCVRTTAEQRAIGRITRLSSIKKIRPDFTIVVCGCIAQKDGEDLITKYPFIDLVIGTRDLPNIANLLSEVRQKHSHLVNIDSIDKEFSFESKPILKSDLKAFITIMYGCNNFCSYCIVPYVRGREVSIPKKQIIDNIKRLVDSGIKEITLIGQNVNSYHDGTTDFPDLLSAVNDVSGIERIRYVTSHPKDCSDKLIDAVANLGHVCENFHLPAQAGSNRILKLMNRGYLREDYIELINKIRATIPNAVITTDLIVGFPGETDDEFEETMDLLEKARWDSSFMFIYSVRTGTKAEELGDTVKEKIKKERIARLIKRQEEISEEINKNMLGSIEEILFESVSKRNKSELMGRTRGDKVIIVPADKSIIRQTAKVKITRAAAHTIFGEII